MEPCLFRHGKGGVGTGLDAVEPASMEPCLFRHGKREGEGRGVLGGDASMEPCLFRHGKQVVVSCRIFFLSCFNGAMSFQTW